MVHFFTKGDKIAGSSRLRAFFVADYLNNLGVQTVVHDPSTVLVSTTAWPRKFFLLVRYVKILLSIKADDVIFLQRTIYNKYFLILIVLCRVFFRRKMIFDFDDAVYLHSPFRTKLLCKISDAVIVAYYTSQSWAKSYNKNVFMIPTSIPFSVYAKEEKDYVYPRTPLLIGWIGNGVDQFVNLQLLGPVFEELKKQGVQFRFRLIGSLGYVPLYDFFTSILGNNVEFIDSLDWTRPENVIGEIKKFDVSVVPLVQDEWNRGKYSLKAIESMSLGVPTIVMSTDGARFLIKNGENGFLASSTSEWVDRIKTLSKMDSLSYEKIGRAGKNTIAEEYSLEANVPKIKDIIFSI